MNDLTLIFQREQENEKTKQELRARHAMYSDAEKKVAQLSTQLAFKNQELLDMEITRTPPPPAPAVASVPPTAVPAAAAAAPTQPKEQQLHTPEKVVISNGAAHPEDGSESQQEATDLEEAIEEPQAPAAQRFKCSKATQRSPQKRKMKAITPSSNEKKRRAMEEPTGTPPTTDVDVLKKKLRACTVRVTPSREYPL